MKKFLALAIVMTLAACKSGSKNPQDDAPADKRLFGSWNVQETWVPQAQATEDQKVILIAQLKAAGKPVPDSLKPVPNPYATRSRAMEISERIFSITFSDNQTGAVTPDKELNGRIVSWGEGYFQVSSRGDDTPDYIYRFYFEKDATTGLINPVIIQRTKLDTAYDVHYRMILME